MSHQLEPWAHREIGWSSAEAAVSESLLALSNGYLGIRGTLDEGEPAALPGTYLNGFHEIRPIPYTDRGYGDPESDQVLVGVADGTRLRLVVNGDPLDVRTGEVLEHQRVLCLRDGMLIRTLHWRTPSGAELRVRSSRMVSLAHREIAAIHYELEAVGRPVRVTVHSELDARLRSPASADPRAGGALPANTMTPLIRVPRRDGAVLVHQTRGSHLLVAAGMAHHVVSPPSAAPMIEVRSSIARWSLQTNLQPGQPVRLVKMLAYNWAPDASAGTLATLTGTCLEHALAIGFEQLAELQRSACDRVWEDADIELDGDPELQHALRYSIFQLHQNTACAAGYAIPAKGLTGNGYCGHTFWDTEIFLLPALAYCKPAHVRDALLWRASTLPAARERARCLGLRGAAFPWRTITGQECSGYLPAGTAAFHINADIAHAVIRYLQATGDRDFEREAGAALLVETARLWASLGFHDPDRGGRFSIDGVTGPDEYSPLVDNNLYTNLMAQTNLRAAAEVVQRLGAEPLGVESGELEAWLKAAEMMIIPYDHERAIHLQDEDFARHQRFDFTPTASEHGPLMLQAPYFQLYRKQVIKQPDMVLAMVLHPDEFTTEQKRRNFAYYEALTVRDSSLAAGSNAVIAAQLGDIQLAYDYLSEAALLDHADSQHNTADGLHLAALAGGWTATIAGLAGVRECNHMLAFAPRLPKPLQRIEFALTYRGCRLRVKLTPTEARYQLHAGDDLKIAHWGRSIRLNGPEPVVVTIPPAAPVPTVDQPAGRAPVRRVQVPTGLTAPPPSPPGVPGVC